jgi:hypothetical protein
MFEDRSAVRHILMQHSVVVLWASSGPRSASVEATWLSLASEAAVDTDAQPAPPLLAYRFDIDGAEKYINRRFASILVYLTMWTWLERSCVL